MTDTYIQPESGWTCFHCGETFTTVGAASDHFGKTQMETPACNLKIQVGGERGLIMELRKATRRAHKSEAEIETLEYQLGVSSADWKRVTGLRSAHDAWFELDSLKGRALAAEAIVDDMAKRVPAMVEASRRRICQLPTGSVSGNEGQTDG